ncbi:MAG: DsbC family protein [Georgfuchsia sp.]
MKSKIFSLLFAALALPTFAQAGDDAIRALFEGKLHSKIEQINKTPVAGLYEVVVDGKYLYVDEKANYFITGNLIDAKTMKNLTSERKFSRVTYDSAVKLVSGNGKNVIVTFEDPNCGYCKKLAHELKQVNDVTIYTFMIPILNEDSANKSKAIWCAADRAKSWRDWMTKGVIPVASADDKCDAGPVLDKNLKLSQSLGIPGTPFMYFPASNQQVPGFIPAAEIEKAMTNKGG